MFFQSLSVLACAGLALAGPTVQKRAVTSLNEAATAEAQQRDNTATRAFSNTQIKTGDGRCLSVDKLAGDFRANLIPIQVAACDGSVGQQWDVITSGKHNNQAGKALIVSSLTQGCLNFDPRRATGNQVILFSCGGRADGEGKVTDSQLFAFDGGAGPLTLVPANSANTCLTVKGNALDQANCNGGATQSFTLGIGRAQAAAAVSVKATVATAQAVNAAAQICSASTVTVTAAAVTITVTAGAAQVASAQSNAPAKAVTTAAAASAKANGILSVNPTTAVPVSRAGGVLQPSAAAEANQRDATATRAFSSVSIRAPNGQCLFIDPTAGDFRQNLIPVQLVTCSGSPNEKFDVITAGKHDNAPGTAIIVSSLTQGCISFDGRRAADDNVTLFACGGRADGNGQTNTGQTIPFKGGRTLVLAPTTGNSQTCLVPGNGRLVGGTCVAGQEFTIV